MLTEQRLANALTKRSSQGPFLTSVVVSVESDGSCTLSIDGVNIPGCVYSDHLIDLAAGDSVVIARSDRSLCVLVRTARAA